MAINLAEAMYFDEEYGRAMPPSPTETMMLRRSCTVVTFRSIPEA
jgi:hypothetical protein